MIRAMAEIRKIMEDRDKHNALRDFLLENDPVFILAINRDRGMIPRYTLDLINVLTKLYDEGYTNASLDLENFR